MTQEFDEHILSTMTAEERAAITEEPTPEEVAAIEAVNTGADEGPDDDEDDAPEAPPKAEESAPPVDAAVDTAPAPEAKAEPEEEKSFRPRYQAQLPENFAEQESSLKEQAEALAAKFKSGELDFDEYRAQAAELSKSEQALNEARIKASISQEMSAQTAEQEWQFTVNRFMRATAKAENIDYTKDTEKQADLDLFVKSLARDPKNGDKDPEWFLVEAHKRVKALHGIGQPAPAATPNPKAADPKARKSPLDAAPKTLAQVPGGDGPGDVDGNEFADIDRLTGDAYEAAIAKMSPATRERYLASA